MDPRHDIGERLEEARVRSGCTYQAVADAVGTNERTVRKWCDGTTLPRADQLRALCHLFGVSADLLLDLPPAIPEGIWILDRLLLDRVLAARSAREVEELLEWDASPILFGMKIPEGAERVTVRELQDAAASALQHINSVAPGLLDSWQGRSSR